VSFKQQVTFFITVSILAGFISNLVRTDAISWMAEPIKVVNNVNDVLLTLLEPEIREIDLEMAKSLHKTGLLFVDARSEEYLSDGIIPGAVANDDVGLLSEQIEFLIGYEKGFVIYCSDDDCGSSEELAYELQDFGFMNIFVFKGGWKSWTDAGLEIEINE
jgi:rhodanese-related sulfurtransferase|tara:strand:- start:310 stop:792 length:483 start_codon:yes stop_codon:yes gene_type:complete